MKLLIITQKADINDENLSFFHRWLEKLAEKAAELRVVCLAEGEHRLPQNTRVYSLGKEGGYSKIRQFFRLQKFLLSSLPEVDGILVHMCPIYAILAAPLAKIFGKRSVMFYAHGGVHFKLRLAEKVVDTILTSSPAGCRLKSKKIKVIGQGIDIDLFRPKDGRTFEEFKILYAGRLNRTKDPEVIIRALDILVNEQNVQKIKLRIIGHPLVESEKDYLRSLKDLAKDRGLDDYVEFIDGVSYFQMPGYYQETDLFVNPSSTGSLDKVVLEAMASGCLILNCNEAYRPILADKYLFDRGDEKGLAQKIVNLMGQVRDPGLREIVVKNHNLDNFIDSIVGEFNKNA